MQHSIVSHSLLVDGAWLWVKHALGEKACLQILGVWRRGHEVCQHQICTTCCCQNCLPARILSAVPLLGDTLHKDQMWDALSPQMNAYIITVSQ